ncbi:MAG: FAD-binding oxidoreductase [Thermoleophilia bacterium]
MADALAETRLRSHLRGSLRTDPGTRELYACDASIYRRQPRGVVAAACADDVAVALEMAREAGVPLTMRGAGTSLAGQAVGRGLVVDTSALRECHVDAERGTALVQPGVVLNDLNLAAAPHGLTFGPDVATANRATLGGMIANNSAGARSIVWGLTADAVTALEVLLADGTRAWLRRGEPAPPALTACLPLAADWEGPGLLRRVSGYNLDVLGGDTLTGPG